MAPGQLCSSLRIITFWSAGRKISFLAAVSKPVNRPGVRSPRWAGKWLSLSLYFLTCKIFADVGFLWEDAPEVGDAGHRDGQKLLHDDQGLLLGEHLIGQQLSLMHKLYYINSLIIIRILRIILSSCGPCELNIGVDHYISKTGGGRFF